MLKMHMGKRTLHRLFLHVSQSPLLLLLLVLPARTGAAPYMAVYM
jgi:hypothetical protein